MTAFSNRDPFQRHLETPEAIARYGSHVLRPCLERLVVVSFPRSGRTWMRVLLDRIGVYLTYSHDESGHQKRQSLSRMETDKSAYASHKVILLIRDPRDVAVSGYFLASHRRKLFDGSLSEFLRDPRHGLHKILHFNRTWFDNRGVPSDFLLVRYERLHSDLWAVLQRILAFADQRVDDQALKEAIEFCRFENMQRLERRGDFEEEYGVLLTSHGKDPSALKTRRGKVGGYQDVLSPLDRDYCDRVIRESGYPLMARVPGEA